MKTIALFIALTTSVFCQGTENIGEFVLKPTTGGTLSQTGFAGSSYSLSYTGGRANTAILLDFDLKSLPALKYKTLKSASLDFKLSSLNNPGRLNITPAWITDKWEAADSLKWNSEIWPKNSYKTVDGYFPRKVLSYRAKEPVFTFTLDWIKNSTIFAQAGNCTINLTSSMRNKIYSGGDAYGLSLLFTLPDDVKESKTSGNAQIISAPELRLVFEGPPPANTEKAIRERALKLYPSASLPPVKDPYIFLLCAYGRSFQDIFWNRFKTFNTEGVYLRPEYEQRGILCLKASAMPNEVKTKWKKSKESFLNDFVTSTSGVAIDEWQSKGKVKRGDPQSKLIGSDSTKTVDNAIAAIREYKEMNPAAIIGVYWRGEDSLQPLAKDQLPDLIMPEIYTSFTEPRLRKGEISRIEDVNHFAWAKEDGYYDRIIPLHGCLFSEKVFPENKKIWTRDRLEHDIRFIKEKHPTFIGQGFYCSIGEKTKENIEAIAPLLYMVDEIFHNVYVKPAPSITIEHPVFEAKLKQSRPHVKIKVNANAQNGRKIIQYRWFIDNRLITETPVNEFQWDTRGEICGKHTITVHAVDSEYYRASTQIPVTVLP